MKARSANHVPRAAILATLLFALAGCPGSDDRLDPVRADLAAHRYDAARVALREAYGARPASAAAAVLLSRAERECGRPEAALAALTGIPEADAARSDVLEQKARALQDRARRPRLLGLRADRRPEEYESSARDTAAAAALAEKLAHGPDPDPDLLLLAARLHLGLGARGAARTWIEEARLAGADRVTCDALEALALAQAGDAPGALERLRALVEREPEHSEALWALGTMLRATRRPADARVPLERAVAADPVHPLAGFELACACFEQGENDPAVEAARQFLETRPDHLGALRLLARAQGARVRWTEAIEALQHAAAAHPTDVDVLNELGMAYYEGAGYKGERLSDSIRTHEKALELEPRHVLNAYNLCRGLVRWNRTEKLERAIEIYESLIARLQGKPAWASLVRDMHRNVGLVLSDSFKRWRRAFDHYRAYFEMGGEVEAGVLDEWGKVLEGLGLPFREPPR